MTRFLPADVLARAAVSPRVDGDLLALYLGDHLTGSSAGAARITDMATRHSDTPMGPELAAIAKEIREERAALRDVIEALGFSTHPLRRVVARVGERVAALKPNGRAFRRSPMTPVLEIELMRAAVNAKMAGWAVLRAYAEELDLPQAPFSDLIAQSERQSDRLWALHAQALDGAFLKD